MNGTENLRGIDYQISYALLHLLRCLVQEGEFPHTLALEDLTDEGADMILEWEGRPGLLVQIKKLSEGYQWTLGRLADVVRKFCHVGTGTSFMFVSNGQGNRDVTALKRAIREGSGVPQQAMDAFLCEECSRERIADVLSRLRIWTRCYPSDNDADPAQGLRREIVRTLAQRRFQLSKPLYDVVQNLWDKVFEIARQGTTVSGKWLLEAFENCGLIPASASWSEYPTARQYYTHAVTVETMAAMMEQAGIMLVTGIGGAGKTTLLAETASRTSTEGRPICWIDVNSLLLPEDLVETVAVYLVDLGLDATARRLRGTPRMERPSELVRQIHANNLRVVVDRINKGGAQLFAFLELAARVCPPGASGILVLTSRDVPTWWDDATDANDYARKIQLHGLPTESGVSLLQDADLGLSEEECRKLTELVGGHPQSLNLLCQAMDVSSGIDASSAVESVRDWILAKVIQELPGDLRAALADLSVYDYPLPRSEAYMVIGAEGPLLLEALIRRDLISLDGAKVAMHDVIRDAAEALLDPPRKNALHSEAAGRVFAEIEEDYRTDDFVLYEKSMKWASHLEKLNDTSSLGDGIRTVLSLQPDELCGLFEIDDRGFPFEFEDPSLQRTWRVIEDLEGRDLVEPWDPGSELTARKKLFKLKGFSFFDRLLVQSLCLRHGYSVSIGYVTIKQFNYAYQKQWLICPWEHCIELFPLPEERHSSCPVFGHDCPGGATQATQCRDADGCAWDDYQSSC